MTAGMRASFRDRVAEIRSTVQSNIVSQISALREENKKGFEDAATKYRAATEKMTTVIERLETYTRDKHSGRVANADLSSVLRV